MARVEAETDEEMRQQEATFDAIPNDRVFYTLKLWANADGNGIEGAGFYNGPKLKAMGLSSDVAVMCNNAAELAHKAGKEAVATAVEMADLADLLGNIFNRLGDTDDSEDNTNTDTEGSDTERAASTGE